MKTKIDKSIVSMVLALMVIVCLFIPVVTSYYIDDRTYNHIILVEGDYINGTVINPEYEVNFTQVNTLFTSKQNRGYEPNNDSYYTEMQGIDQVYYGNWVTYIGNGTNQVNADFNIMDNDTTNNMYLIPLEIKSHDIIDYDFLRLTTDCTHSGIRIYSTAIRNKFADINGYRLLVFDVSEKATAKANINENVLLAFGGDLATLNLDEENENWTFKLEGFYLTNSDTYFWSDEHLYYSSIGISIAIMVIAFTFSTQIIDVKIDNQRPKRKR
jgi:hypothetical protein